MPEDLYTELLGLPPGPRPPNHYAILGLTLFEPDAEAVHEAVLRQTAELKRYVLHPDPDRIRRVQELLNEVHAAGVILQDPKTKAPYDDTLAEQLGIALHEPVTTEAKEPLGAEPLPEIAPPPVMAPGTKVQAVRAELPRPRPTRRTRPFRAKVALAAAALALTVLVLVGVLLPAFGKRGVALVGLAPPEPEAVSLDLGGGVSVDFVPISPGSFMMGDDKGEENERPARKVTINRPFYMGKSEVTQQQWQAVMGYNHSRFRGLKNPVDSVSWEDCQAFLAKLNERLPDGRFRLPTEAEWEYGCRAGISTRFSHGDDELTLGDYAWHRGNSAGTTHPVGEKRPNVWGLHDMHGNVLEFCDDIYVPCPGEQWNPVAVKEGRLRVVRGGSWYRGAAACCSTARDGMSIEYGDFQYGFRIVFAPGSQDPRQVLAAFGREFCAARVQASLSALQTAVDKGDKFAAEQRLTQVRGLLQQDPRVAVLARRVAALPEPQTTTLDLGKGVAIELVRIPPGKFLPGDPTGLRQQPTHQVTIKRGFYLGKCEVTQEQWQAVMGRRATARVVSPSFTDATRPVDRATAQDCQDFLERLNAHVSVVTLRLPSREEWEYACRAGSTTSYCFGESEGGLAEYAWFTRNAGGRPQPVGRKMANAWGLHDMHGNVAEWCDDGSLRGGTWFDLACNCRSASRRGGNYSGGTGLRVAFMPTGATSAETEPAPVSEPPVVEQPAPPPKMGPLELRAHLPVGVPPRLPGSDDGDKVVFDTGPFHAILQPPDAVARQNQALRFEPDPGNPDAVLVKHRSGSGFGYETLLVCKRQGGQMVWEINKDKAQDYAACLQHLAVVAVTRKNGDEVCLPCMRKREPESRNLVLAYRADGSLASAREEATWTCRYPWPQALYVQHKDMQGGKPLRLTGPHASSGGGVDISSGTDPTGRFTAVTFTGVMRAPGRPLSEVRLVLKFTVGNETNTMEGTAVTAVLSCAGIKEYMEDTKGALPNEGRLPQEVFRGIEGVMLLDPWGIPLAVLTPMLRADLGPGRAIPTTTVPPTELTPPEHKEQPPRVCPGCRGKAVVPCPDCGGKGVARVERKRCGNCDGKGGGRCKECGGKGFGRCPDCGGSGRIWRSSGGRPFRRVDCDRCAATGLGSRCTHCGGDGRAECGECNGKGTVPAPVPCAKCKGDKTVPCPDCGGQGSLPGR